MVRVPVAALLHFPSFGLTNATGVSVGAALLVAAMDKNGESYLREIGTLDDKEPEVVKFKVTSAWLQLR